MKKKFDVSKYIKKRNADLNKVEESKATKPFGAGSHHLKALQMRHGFTKPKTIKKLERIAHLKKRKLIEGA